MTQRRVRLTATAGTHIDEERAWWLDNRDHQELFATELESAVTILAILRGAGAPYSQVEVPCLRRIYLRRIGCHIYYTFNDSEAVIRALWGARRARGPMMGK